MLYTRQQLEEISKVQNELKQLAKRLQYYDEDKMEGEEDKSVKLQVICSYVPSLLLYRHYSNNNIISITTLITIDYQVIHK